MIRKLRRANAYIIRKFCLININISQEIDKENNIISYELSIGTLFKAKLKK